MSASTAEQAIAELLAGNWRFVSGVLAHPHQSPSRRAELVTAQHPFAAMLCCSDSRVPPEILFDQGLGDLFVVRVAGNTLDDVVIGSIEYAVDHLRVPLVVVLGHGQCGAVTAALGAAEHEHDVASSECVRRMLSAIEPAVQQARGRSGELLDNAIHCNVELVVGQLRSRQPSLTAAIAQGRLRIVGAYYHMDNGVVDIIA